ncbi:Methyltransferase type 11 [Candidatus Sulfotelmatobacter kueseliae]|uniref:Methyltransferase type 11 n=1 Tax=Candidatus Sulfotelmatobacter kueseliae TaxID=2042962 RepID=A0A2U3KV48_9BACT|nr:Methyltransferase type 11 [Candidatus Sulfotelmatobacter kueseliae]
MSNENSTREILGFYTAADEASRLRTGWFQLEQARTEELILRHLPPPPATIVDAGGGAGAYACWLATRGYQVHLIDPVPKHVEQARAASNQQPEHPLASAEVGDARHLPRGDASADAVLLLGPLYHLVEKEDRLACLREARRVLRPEGFAWGAAISRFASLLDSLSHGFFDDPAFAPVVARDLEDGQHRNPTGNPLYFTDAYLHRPGELSREFLAAGFQIVELAAIEGPGWIARDFDRLWNDPAQRERLLAVVRKVEKEPSVLGASSHIMAIGRK